MKVMLKYREEAFHWKQYYEKKSKNYRMRRFVRCFSAFALVASDLWHCICAIRLA